MQVIIDVKPRPATEPGALDAFMLDCSACGPKLDLGSSLERLANQLADEHQRWHASPAAVPIAERVRGYRARLAADPELYDGDGDVVYWLISDTPYRTWTPSEVGRAVGIATVDAGFLLRHLVKGGHIAADGNGAWTHYRSAR